MRGCWCHLRVAYFLVLEVCLFLMELFLRILSVAIGPFSWKFSSDSRLFTEAVELLERGYGLLTWPGYRSLFAHVFNINGLRSPIWLFHSLWFYNLLICATDSHALKSLVYRGISIKSWRILLFKRLQKVGLFTSCLQSLSHIHFSMWAYRPISWSWSSWFGCTWIFVRKIALLPKSNLTVCVSGFV